MVPCKRVGGMAIATLVTLPAMIASAAPEFIDPGVVDLPLNWYRTASALAVSSDGSVVVGTSLSGFRWSKETGIVRLGGLRLGEFDGAAEAVTADGRWIAGNVHASYQNPVPILWTSSGWTRRIDFGEASQSTGYAKDVSADGQFVVGHYERPSGEEAFIWSASTGMQFIGKLPSAEASFATAISANGTIVAGFSNTAFLWTSELGMLDLGTYGNHDHSAVLGLSADGTVAVGHAYSDEDGGVALVWRDGVLQAPLDVPGAVASTARAANRDGGVIVGSYRVEGMTRGFVWTAETGAIDLTLFAESLGLDLQGATLAIPKAISDDGSTIVGSYYPIDVERAFILRDLPLGDNRCSPCAADFDGDGGVTGGDLAAFMVAYEAGARCADVDDDSVVDGNDVAAFLAAFERGGCE